MIFVLLLIYTVKAIGLVTDEVSKIAFNVPSFSNQPVNIFYKIFYGIWLVMFLIFLFMRKSFFIGLQKQAVILQGMFFGVDISVYTALGGISSSIPWLIALVSAPLAALLSVNEKFKNIFIAMVNAFAISYIACIVFRIASILKIAFLGVIAYFLIIVLISGSERFQLCFAKIFTGTIAIISLIDLMGFISVFSGLHGLSSTSTMAFIYYFLTGFIMLLLSAYFISITYFGTWVDKKVEEVAAHTTTTTETE